MRDEEARAAAAELRYQATELEEKMAQFGAVQKRLQEMRESEQAYRRASTDAIGALARDVAFRETVFASTLLDRYDRADLQHKEGEDET